MNCFVAGFSHLKPLSSEALSLKCIQCQALAPVKEVAQANMALRSALVVVPGLRGPPKNVEECLVETISNNLYPRLHTPVAYEFVLFISKVH